MALNEQPVVHGISCYMQVQEDPRAGIAWVSGEGQLYCVSKGFMALLGYSFRDMQRKIQAIGEAQLFVCLSVRPSASLSVNNSQNIC